MADKSILYIEDNFHNRRIVRKILEKQGYTINEADDGIKGFEILKKDKPPLVLLDISLPGMDGIEIAKRVKASEELKDIFLIALTASAMAGDRERFLAAGCDDYLSKPFKAADLVEMIDTHYKRIIFEDSTKKNLPRNKEIRIPNRMNIRAAPRHIKPAMSSDTETLNFSSQPKKSVPSEKDSKPEAITPPVAKEKETETAPKTAPEVAIAPSNALQSATSNKVESASLSLEKTEIPISENKTKDGIDSNNKDSTPTKESKSEVVVEPKTQSIPKENTEAKAALPPILDNKPEIKAVTKKKSVGKSKPAIKAEAKAPKKISKLKAKPKAAAKAAPKAKKAESKAAAKPGKAEKDEKITKGIIEPVSATAPNGNGRQKESAKSKKSEKMLASEREEMIRTMLSDTINSESIKPPHPNIA